jgi:drug/metabolite transporter (DMT)-like permease
VQVTGLSLALLASAMFAVNGTVSKLVLTHGLSPSRLVEIRSAGSALCLLVVIGITRPRTLRVQRGELGFLVATGVVGIGLVQWFYLVSIRRLPVGIALLLEYLAPVLVALWVRFVLHRPVRSRLWAALALAVAGLVVVAQVWRGLTLDGLGLVAGLASAVSLAVYYLTGEHGLATRDAVSLAAWMFLTAAVFWAVVLPWWTYPWPALTRSVPLPGPLAGRSATLWLLVTWVVVLGTVVPYLLTLLALRHLGPARTGLVGMAEPVLAGVVAWVVLGESLGAAQLAGSFVVLVGIVLAETSRQKPAVAVGLPEGIAP